MSVLGRKDMQLDENEAMRWWWWRKVEFARVCSYVSVTYQAIRFPPFYFRGRFLQGDTRDSEEFPFLEGDKEGKEQRSTRPKSDLSLPLAS